jgi:hypothetical protein
MPAYRKLATTKEKMIEKKGLQPDGNPIPIRVLGFLELLGIIGIIVPRLTGILTILTPIAAVCFGIVMVGAFVVHVKKHEYKVLPIIVLAFVLSLVVAWFRFSEMS